MSGPGPGCLPAFAAWTGLPPRGRPESHQTGLVWGISGVGEGGAAGAAGGGGQAGAKKKIGARQLRTISSSRHLTISAFASHWSASQGWQQLLSSCCVRVLLQVCLCRTFRSYCCRAYHQLEHQ